MTMQTTDVLVLGLGPAGASAAAAASRRGLRVLALDRKHVAGMPVQCAELVPSLLGEHVAAARSAYCQAISAMHTYVEDADCDIAPSFPGSMLDRARFDRALVETARASGADCRFDTAVTRVTGDGHVTTASGDAVAAKVVIGADGPLSLVGRAIGQRNRALVFARQMRVPLLARQAVTDIFLSDQYVGGYGWLFPKGNEANLGVGVASGARPRLKSLLTTLHRRLIDAGRVGSNILAVTGGAIPVGGMLRPVVERSQRLFLLAGDAAGLTNPITGAGIHAALVSGALAGDAAADWLTGASGAGREYGEELAAIFAPSLARAAQRRERLWDGDLRASRTPGALRAGWIAYPEYWRDRRTSNQVEVSA